MYPFREGCFAPKNGWYVAAFASELGRELVSRWILNEPVAMYRTLAGEAVAVNGRCPHRHFPLGMSRLVGDTIVCGYHGITFGSDGRCVSIPSQANVPRTYALARYPLVEHGLWMFIWMGDPEKADLALLPDLAEADFEQPNFRFQPFFTLEVPGRYQLLNDNLLDLTHLAFLHGTSIGVPANANFPEVREEYPNMLRSRRHMTSVPMAPAHRGRAGYEGPVDRVSGMDFHLPGFHTGLDDMSVPADHPTRAGEKLSERRVFHAVTPAKKNTATYFFAYGGPLSDAEFDEARVSLRPVIEEDIFATREIEAMLETLDYTPTELMLKSDASAVRGRRALQAMMDREQDAQTRSAG
jgi:phenylpropionate dioxygenase-like ring-hydroxylating dioxygenase large terminal subunit